MEQGYVILQGVVSASLTPDDISQLDEMPVRHLENIADTATPGGKPASSQLRQMMSPYKVPTELRAKLVAALNAIQDRLDSDGMLGPEAAPTHKVEGALLLRAKRGCKWQSYVHCDRGPEHSMQDDGFELMHYSAMAALMGDTTLWIKPIGSERLVEVTIPEGCVLCWRGDIGHAGSAHPEGCQGGHYRLFLHVDAKGRPITKKERESLYPCEYIAT